MPGPYRLEVSAAGASPDPVRVGAPVTYTALLTQPNGAHLKAYQHIAQSIRASVILGRLTQDGKGVIEELFPELREHAATATRLHPRPGDPGSDRHRISRPAGRRAGGPKHLRDACVAASRAGPLRTGSGFRAS